MSARFADALESATHRLDDAIELLARVEQELGEVSDPLAERTHWLVAQVEELHRVVARAWASLDGVA